MRGRIKLIKAKKNYVINEAVYTSVSERDAIIDSWRLLHGVKMMGWYLHIQPFYDSGNENKWSRRV